MYVRVHERKYMETLPLIWSNDLCYITVSSMFSHMNVICISEMVGIKILNLKFILKQYRTYITWSQLSSGHLCIVYWKHMVKNIIWKGMFIPISVPGRANISLSCTAVFASTATQLPDVKLLCYYSKWNVKEQG